MAINTTLASLVAWGLNQAGVTFRVFVAHNITISDKNMVPGSMNSVGSVSGYIEQGPNVKAEAVKQGIFAPVDGRAWLKVGAETVVTDRSVLRGSDGNDWVVQTKPDVVTYQGGLIVTCLAVKVTIPPDGLS